MIRLCCVGINKIEDDIVRLAACGIVTTFTSPVGDKMRVLGFLVGPVSLDMVGIQAVRIGLSTISPKFRDDVVVIIHSDSQPARDVLLNGKDDGSIVVAELLKCARSFKKLAIASTSDEKLVQLATEVAEKVMKEQRNYDSGTKDCDGL